LFDRALAAAEVEALHWREFIGGWSACRAKNGRGPKPTNSNRITSHAMRAGE
jgi:hypothetical protein